MADERNEWTPERHKGNPNDPANPPNSMIAPETRRAALLSYLGPILALFVIVGVAMIYWMNRGPDMTDIRDEDTIGTVGREPGGFDPGPDPDSARDEIEFRGGAADTGRLAGPAVTTVDRALSTDPSQPQRVTLDGVEVESVEGDVIWVRSGDARIAVTAAGGERPRAGQRIDVTGTTELDARGGVRIRASEIDLQ